MSTRRSTPRKRVRAKAKTTRKARRILTPLVKRGPFKVGGGSFVRTREAYIYARYLARKENREVRVTDRAGRTVATF